jgi:hypothetical protein
MAVQIALQHDRGSNRVQIIASLACLSASRGEDIFGYRSGEPLVPQHDGERCELGKQRALRADVARLKAFITGDIQGQSGHNAVDQQLGGQPRDIGQRSALQVDNFQGGREHSRVVRHGNANSSFTKIDAEQLTARTVRRPALARR